MNETAPAAERPAPFAAKKPCKVCGGRIAAPVAGHPGYCSRACVHEFYGTTESDTP